MQFNVLPVARVGNEMPPEIAPQAVENIFIFSALMGLSGPEIPPETVLDHTLRSFLELVSSEEKNNSRSRPPLLIFDQLEELFTRHRDRWQDAKGFFQQVQESLDTVPRLGVVFTLREDYVAEIDSYTLLFPDRLRARFRMERLGKEGALEAVTKPALNAGCPFDPGVAEKLVDNLRQIKVQRHVGAEEETVLGQFVEPVQLQVVCNRLWENLPEQEDNAIQWEEVEEYGDVDRALTDFYEDAVRRVVGQTGVYQDQLRDWFERQLITEGGTRASLYRGTDTGGLPNEAADLLVDMHILRTDTRAGGRWVELVHDRLVEPITRANATWRQAHPLIQDALEWQEAGKPASKLYQGEQLRAAWNDPDAKFVRAFLRTGQRAQEKREAAIRAEEEIKRRVAEIRAEEQSHSNRRLRWLVAVLVAVFAVAVGAAIAAVGAQETAVSAQRTAVSAQETAVANADLAAVMAFQIEAQRQIALAQSLAALAPHTNNNDELTTLLAIESLNILGKSLGPAGWLIDRALRDVLSKPYFNNMLRGHEDWIKSVAFSPDGQWLASGSDDRTVRVWDMNDLETPPYVLSGHEDWVSSVAFSPDGRWLASGSNDRTVRVWDMNDLAAPPRVFSSHESRVRSVAFSPDGRWLASGSDDRTVRVWDMNDLAAPPHVLSGHENWVESVAFSPDGRWLASGSDDRTVRVWDMSDLAAAARVLSGHESVVSSVAFSPDGQRLASGSDDRTVRVWISTLEELAEIGCQRVYRNMTREEWNRYLPGEPYRATCPNRPVPED